MIDSEEESFKRNVYGFSIDYDAIDKSNIQNKMENINFDIDNISIDEKSHKNILIYGIP